MKRFDLVCGAGPFGLVERLNDKPGNFVVLGVSDRGVTGYDDWCAIIEELGENQPEEPSGIGSLF